jgi:hypothetical protein
MLGIGLEFLVHLVMSDKVTNQVHRMGVISSSHPKCILSRAHVMQSAILETGVELSPNCADPYDSFLCCVPGTGTASEAGVEAGSRQCTWLMISWQQSKV